MPYRNRQNDSFRNTLGSAGRLGKDAFITMEFEKSLWGWRRALRDAVVEKRFKKASRKGLIAYKNVFFPKYYELVSWDRRNNPKSKPKTGGMLSATYWKITDSDDSMYGNDTNFNMPLLKVGIDKDKPYGFRVNFQNRGTKDRWTKQDPPKHRGRVPRRIPFTREIEEEYGEQAMKAFEGAFEQTHDEDLPKFFSA